MTTVLVGTVYSASSETSSSPVYPAGIAAGDTLLLAFSYAGTTTLWPSANATAIGYTFGDSISAVSNSPVIGWATKVATGSETGALAFSHAGGGPVSAVIMALRDWDPTQDSTEQTYLGSVTDTKVTLPAGTTSDAGALAIAITALNATAATDSITTGTGWTEDVASPQGTRCWTVAHKTITSAGTTGGFVVTYTSTAKGCGLLISFQAKSLSFSGSLALSGSGTQVDTGTPAVVGSVTLTGTGTGTNAGTPAIPGTLALAGAGTQSDTGKPAASGTLGLSGAGTQSDTGVATTPGAVSFTGAGTLAFSGTPGTKGTVALSGSGTGTDAGLPNLKGSLATSGSGTLSGTGIGITTQVAKVLSVIRAQVGKLASVASASIKKISGVS